MYQLEHAGNTPLYLTILFPYKYGEKPWTKKESTQALSVRLANIFRDTMPRWKFLQMRARRTQVQLFVNGCTGPTPNLSRIYIKLRTKPGHRASPPTLSIPFWRPAEVDLGPSVLAGFGSVLPIYCDLSVGARVTRLAVQVPVIDLQDFITMLSSCPNLVVLDVTGRKPGATVTGVLGPNMVPLSHLVDLRMSYIRNPARLLGMLRLEALQSLRVDHCDWTLSMSGVLQNIFQTCRSLTTVDMEESMLSSRATIDPPVTGEWIVLPSVTHFRMFGDLVIYSLLWRILLPQLITATINTYGATSHPAPIVPIVTFPSLSSIWITTPSLEVISLVNAPNLTEFALILGCHYGPPHPHHSALVRNFINTSGPALRKLSLSGIGLGDKDIIWCLQRLPLLEGLDIRDANMSNITLRALGVPPSYEQGDIFDVLLPRLRLASFGRCYHTTAEGFAALAACRPAVVWTREPG
ncbi:hypothetical protein BOTBODRAFT_172661 [Botryobasidium botryosum FD-172 SS1]|uniref:F-box domain-containing protein n=1 Tax=Botryobasidium botryosum (strain FD-172 SS1) TaxID=930990 RepID=A0A067MQS9_BOTB1|nr:hypothetical protein BOTBODRAFT_172661 [Botryobasidium botryosum FD-172 SS1]